MPVVHLLRDRRGDPADRRAPGLLRRRPRDVLRDAPRRSGPRSRRARRPSSPSISSATSRPVAEIEALGVPVIEDAAQAAGLALGRRAPRRAGHARHLQLLPVEEPRLLRRRRRDHDRRRRARRSRAHAALPRLVGQGHATSTSATTRAWTRSRRRSCASSCRTSTGGPTDAARAGRALRGGRPRRARRAAGRRRRAASRRGISTSCAASTPTRWPPRSRGAGIGHKAYYRTPTHRQPAMAEYADGVELPATDEVARTHLAIPMSPVLDARSGRSGRRRGAFGR